MVVVGGLSIKGTMNTQNVDSGFARVKSGFQQVGKFAKSVRADLVRMGQDAGRLSSAFKLIGLAGVGTFIALAKSSPAVAPAMAKITLETQRLSRALGQSLRPVFESFADGYSKFVNFVENHPDLTRGFVLSVGALAGIAALSKFVSVLSTVAVSASVLQALALAGVIGAAGFVAFKGAEAGSNFLNEKLGLDGGSQQTAGTWVNRLGQKVSSSLSGNPTPWEDVLNPNSPVHARAIQEIKDAGFQPTPGGTMNAIEGEINRRNFLLGWWDSVWS